MKGKEPAAFINALFYKILKDYKKATQLTELDTTSLSHILNCVDPLLIVYFALSHTELINTLYGKFQFSEELKAIAKLAFIQIEDIETLIENQDVATAEVHNAPSFWISSLSGSAEKYAASEELSHIYNSKTDDTEIMKMQKTFCEGLTNDINDQIEGRLSIEIENILNEIETRSWPSFYGIGESERTIKDKTKKLPHGVTLIYDAIQKGTDENKSAIEIMQDIVPIAKEAISHLPQTQHADTTAFYTNISQGISIVTPSPPQASSSKDLS